MTKFTFRPEHNVTQGKRNEEAAFYSVSFGKQMYMAVISKLYYLIA